MPITNGRWIYEAFEQIMTLSSIREYVPSIRKCTSIHTHYIQIIKTKQKIKTQIKQTWRKREKHFYDLYYLFLVHGFFLAPFHSGLNYVPQRGEYTAISILCAALVRLQSRLQRLTTRWALLDATAEKHGRKYVVSQGPLKKWTEHFIFVFF